MTNERTQRRINVNMNAGATGRQLLSDGSLVLPMYDADPAAIILSPPDGLTVAWWSTTHSYHSTYYSALGAWRKIELT